MDEYTTTVTTNSCENATAHQEADDFNREPFRIAGVTIGIIDIFVGSIGNLLTILAIAGNKKLHKPFHIFIANLSVIDFLTATTMMPFNVTAYYKQVSRPCGPLIINFSAKALFILLDDRHDAIAFDLAILIVMIAMCPQQQTSPIKFFL